MKVKAVGAEPRSAYEDHLRHAKLAFVPRVRSILDVGCGSGRVFGLRSVVPVLDGVEPDPVLRSEAERAAAYRNVYRSLDDAPPVASYECVTLMGVLEHIPDDVAFLNQFADARMIYLTVPNAKSFHRLVGVEMGLIRFPKELGPQDEAVGHHRYYDVGQLQELIDPFAKANGLKVKEIGTTAFKMLPNSKMSQLLGHASAFDAVANRLGLCGRFCLWGAEIYALLVRE